MRVWQKISWCLAGVSFNLERNPQAWQLITQFFHIIHAENVTLRNKFTIFHTKTRKNTVFQVFQFNLDELTYRNKRFHQVFDCLP